VPEYNFDFNAALKNAIDCLRRVSAGTRALQMIKQVATT
jgi:hypothetical protein